MKIMMVITGMCSGGAERVMATLCNELVKSHDVRLLAMKEAVSDYYIDEKIEFIGGNVTNQNVFKSVSFVANQMNEWKPDIVLSFMTKSNIIALTAKKIARFKPPVVIAERANPYYAGRVFKVIRRFLYPAASGCVFQTNQAQDYYKNILKCESIVLRNPLNPDFKVKPYEGERKHRIITMGRLSVEKNQKLLIDAFVRIAEKYPSYQVEIYGEGPLREELEQHIIKCGMQNRVKLMGRKNQVQKYIADAEIFVLPSNSEGMPNALLEAMALGMACIATDCPIGGSAVIIQNNENGILVPMNDVNTMATAIEKMIADEDFRKKVSSNACKITQTFETTKVCHEWDEYLCKTAKRV